MKRKSLFIIATIIVLMLPACTSSDNTQDEVTNITDSDAISTEDESETVLRIGETYTCDDYEITVTRVETGPYIHWNENANSCRSNGTPITVRDNDFAMAGDESIKCKLLTSKDDYAYISAELQIKYKGKTSPTNAFYPDIIIKYGDGYEFSNDVSCTLQSDGSWFFGAAPDYKPLDDSVHIIRSFCEVPEKVITDKDAPLSLYCSNSHYGSDIHFEVDLTK